MPKKKRKKNPSSNRAFVIFSEGSDRSVRTLWAGLAEGRAKIPGSVMNAAVRFAASEQRRVGENDFVTIEIVEVKLNVSENVFSARSYEV